jgi:hypothetical protein
MFRFGRVACPAIVVLAAKSTSSGVPPPADPSSAFPVVDL